MNEYMVSVSTGALDASAPDLPPEVFLAVAAIAVSLSNVASLANWYERLQRTVALAWRHRQARAQDRNIWAHRIPRRQLTSRWLLYDLADAGADSAAINEIKGLFRSGRIDCFCLLTIAIVLQRYEGRGKGVQN
jgi:hypothetical protein